MDINEFEQAIQERMPGSTINYNGDGSNEIIYKGNSVKTKPDAKLSKNMVDQIATKMFFILNPRKKWSASIPKVIR